MKASKLTDLYINNGDRLKNVIQIPNYGYRIPQLLVNLGEGEPLLRIPAIYLRNYMIQTGDKHD